MLGRGGLWGGGWGGGVASAGCDAGACANSKFVRNVTCISCALKCLKSVQVASIFFKVISRTLVFISEAALWSRSFLGRSL